MKRDENKEIRAAIVLKGLKHWEVARALGIHDSNFSRLLRKELPENKKNEILKVIEGMEVS